MQSVSHSMNMYMWINVNVESPRAVKTVHFSLDGLRVVSGSDDTSVRNWDLATGACITTLRGHQVTSMS